MSALSPNTPIYTHRLAPHLIVCLHGTQPALKSHAGPRHARELMRLFFPGSVGRQTVLITPPETGAPGHRFIKVINSETERRIPPTTITADGVIVHCYSATNVIMQTRDWPVVTLANTHRRAFAVINASRELLKPGVSGQDILTAGLLAIAPDPGDRARVFAHISASIGAARFRHDQNPSITYSFYNRFSWRVYEGEAAQAGQNLTLVAGTR